MEETQTQPNSSSCFPRIICTLTPASCKQLAKYLLKKRKPIRLVRLLHCHTSAQIHGHMPTCRHQPHSNSNDVDMPPIPARNPLLDDGRPACRTSAYSTHLPGADDDALPPCVCVQVSYKTKARDDAKPKPTSQKHSHTRIHISSALLLLHIKNLPAS